MSNKHIDVRTRIREAQGEIIDRLANCETLLAALYSVYSDTIPNQKDFWTQLAREEESHAKVLMTLHSILEKGRIFYNLDRFNGQVITDYINRIMSETEAARRTPVTPLVAVSNALSLEIALIDTRFYDTVASDAPEFTLIAKQLSIASRKHIEHIQEQHTLLLKAQGTTPGSRRSGHSPL